MDMNAYIAKRYGAVKELDLLQPKNATKKKKKQKKKEVKKEHTAEQGLRIIDEDAVWQKEIRLDVEENDDEIAPVIVETEEDIQRRRLEMLSQQPFLKVGEDGSGWVEISPGDSKPKISQASTSTAHLSPVRSDVANEQQNSPPRRQRNDSPDLSPPRREARQDTVDLSRVKQEDLSPPRRGRHDSPDPSPHRRRARHDSPDFAQVKQEELSPPGRGTDKDLSPPRRRARHDSPDKDLSPPRRRARHDSPDKDLSPPRRRARHDSPDKDLSPPRRGARHLSPAKEDLSPPRRGRDLSPPRRRARHDSPDSSLPRRGKQEDEDLSPRRRRTKHDSRGSSPPRRNRDFTPPKRDRQDSPGPRRTTRHDLPEKAGLKTGRELREEIQRKQEHEAKRFQELDASITGRGAETVYRDKHGKKVGYEELMKQQQGTQKPAEKKIEWGSGLAQKRDAEKQREELDAEKNKPFARTKADLDDILKNRVRWGDPMAHLVKNAGIEGELEDFSMDEKMRESGFIVPQDIPAHSWIKRRLAAALNRYDIRPGRHWDGVDRSNGFEGKMFKQRNEKKALVETAYKWSVADM